MKQGYRHAIFDLDGTVIDSAPAILACYRAVLAMHGMEPKVAIDSRLIGPPLLQTMALLTGSDDKAVLCRLVDEFKFRYDREGVYATLAYSDIEVQLVRLREVGSQLHIATNKRYHPTVLLLEHLGLAHYFDSVYAIDRADPPYPDKLTMLGEQLADLALPVERCCYVGDKHEDGLSADANGLAFYCAGWGYGDWSLERVPAQWTVVPKPSDLSKFINANSAWVQDETNQHSRTLL